MATAAATAERRRWICSHVLHLFILIMLILLIAVISYLSLRHLDLAELIGGLVGEESVDGEGDDDNVGDAELVSSHLDMQVRVKTYNSNSICKIQKAHASRTSESGLVIMI